MTMGARLQDGEKTVYSINGVEKLDRYTQKDETRPFHHIQK